MSTIQVQMKMSRIVIVAVAVISVSAELAAQDSVSLAGVIDFHTHAGPDSRPRSVNDIDAARQARTAGVRGLVFKNHFTMTADRAALAMAQVDGIEIYGGIVLNRAVGGLNAEAVRQMVLFEGGRGKVVWLPTFDAEHYVQSHGSSDPFVSVVKDGRPVQALTDIFDSIAKHDLVLAMGHSSPEEVLLLIPEARRIGVKHILVTHVFGQGPTRIQMRRMAASGAVMELDWYAVYQGRRSVADYVSVIQEIGAEHFLISSDLGQRGSPSHTDGLRTFVRVLREQGISDGDIAVMAGGNPAKLLGLKALP